MNARAKKINNYSKTKKIIKNNQSFELSTIMDIEKKQVFIKGHRDENSYPYFFLKDSIDNDRIVWAGNSKEDLIKYIKEWLSKNERIITGSFTEIFILNWVNNPWEITDCDKYVSCRQIFNQEISSDERKIYEEIYSI